MNSDNRRVTKNTVLLYGRMIIVMLIGMWTSRLVLNALGFADQGLYNVVGGFVSFLNLLSYAVSMAISRYITFEIGKGDNEGIKKAIKNAVAVEIVLSLGIIVLAETLGIWYVNNVLVVPSGRLIAVNYVFQFSVFSFIAVIFTSAPQAIVIAYERMNIYAWASIASAVGTLVNALIISFYGYDRLILYSLLQLCIPIGIFFLYCIFSKKICPFCSFKPAVHKEVFRPMFSFAGWNMIGSSAGIIRTSGTSLLLNFFGGPIANTINGIAMQVNVLASMFVKDFTTSFNPQITKKYAAGEYSALVSFLHSCSKFSYCLLLIMAVPVFLHIDRLLTLWLKEIPQGTVIFARLVIIFTAFECISQPLITAKNATGKIRNYQIVVGGILLLTIPLSYLFLRCGLSLWYSYLAMIITSVGAFIARMFMLNGSIPGWKSAVYLKDTGFKCLLATISSLILPVGLLLVSPSSLPSVISQCVLGFGWCAFCVLFVACTKEERRSALSMITKLFCKFNFTNSSKSCR